MSCHWLGGKGAGIDGVAKLPAGGGFVTNGRDGAVRLWQTTEGTPQMCTKVFSLPPIAGLPEGAEVYTKMALSAEFVALTIPGGAVQVLSLPDLVPVYRHQHTSTAPLTGGESDLWASDVKFSPDGTTLALVSGGAVVLFTITPSALVAAVAVEGGEGEAPPPVVEGEEGAEGATATAPAQFLTPKEGFDVSEFAPHTLDFSSDAQYVRVTDAARGVLSVRQLFYTAPPPVEPVDPPPPAAEGEEGEVGVAAVVEPVEAPKGIPVGTECVDPEILRPMTFASNSVPCAWDLKGVWNAHAGAIATGKVRVLLVVVAVA